MHLLSLAALFLLLQAEFVAAAQVVVYAGAVMVLYVFVVAYVGGDDEPVHPSARPVASRASRCSSGWRCSSSWPLAVLGSGLKAVDSRGADMRRRPSARPDQIGELLLTKFLFAFEVASFLLLIAAVGAVVLARRRGGIGADEADRVAVTDFSAAAGTGTMAEAVGARDARVDLLELRPRRRRAGASRPAPRPEGGMVSSTGTWWSRALIFCIGAAGVLTRRNPLVILLCLELMLNAANLALHRLRRMWGNARRPDLRDHRDGRRRLRGVRRPRR